MPYAQSVETRSDFDNSEDEQRILAELDRLTEINEMAGIYFTQAGRALAIPVSFESDEVVDYIRFNLLTFEGKLATYSIVKIGKIIGATSVRALCLTFVDVTLLPFFDKLPGDKLLHVPALAVDSMSRSEA